MELVGVSVISFAVSILNSNGLNYVVSIPVNTESSNGSFMRVTQYNACPLHLVSWNNAYPSYISTNDDGSYGR